MAAFAALLPLLFSAGTSATGGILGSNAAENAANTQEQAEQGVLNSVNSTVPAANSDIAGGVAGANKQLAGTYAQNLGLLAPYLGTGTSALAQLNALTSGGGFKAPTAADAANMPGYQFQLAQGEQAADRSAAAQGTALTGGQLKASDEFAQGLASTNYGNAYNQALGTYQTNFGNLQQLAGLGLNATNTGVQTGDVTGTQAASNTTQGGYAQAQNLLAGLGISADALTGAANARASGYVGSANAYGGALNNIGSAATSYGNNQSQLALLNSILNKNSANPLGIQPTGATSSVAYS